MWVLLLTLSRVSCLQLQHPAQHAIDKNSLRCTHYPGHDGAGCLRVCVHVAFHMPLLHLRHQLKCPGQLLVVHTQADHGCVGEHITQGRQCMLRGQAA